MKAGLRGYIVHVPCPATVVECQVLSLRIREAVSKNRKQPNKKAARKPGLHSSIINLKICSYFCCCPIALSRASLTLAASNFFCVLATLS